MRTQFTASGGAHSCCSAVSSSSCCCISTAAADRRLNALVRHLGIEDSKSAMADISANPTSASNGDSVFAHVVRAPEDPILGVFLLLFISFHFRFLPLLSYIP